MCCDVARYAQLVCTYVRRSGLPVGLPLPVDTAQRTHTGTAVGKHAGAGLHRHNEEKPEHWRRPSRPDQAHGAVGRLGRVRVWGGSIKHDSTIVDVCIVYCRLWPANVQPVSNLASRPQQLLQCRITSHHIASHHITSRTRRPGGAHRLGRPDLPSSGPCVCGMPTRGCCGRETCRCSSSTALNTSASACGTLSYVPCGQARQQAGTRRWSWAQLHRPPPHTADWAYRFAPASTSHRITSHHITSHHITSHHIIPGCGWCACRPAHIALPNAGRPRQCTGSRQSACSRSSCLHP